jgi:hypothetical protein
VTNPDTLWAREGDVMLRAHPEWSPFASMHDPDWRSAARFAYHGFDFRVESVNGTKTLVKEEEQ